MVIFECRAMLVQIYRGAPRRALGVVQRFNNIPGSPSLSSYCTKGIYVRDITSFTYNQEPQKDVAK